ncbi:hypothetical protein F5Y14DRAFT_10041 [Nemania sp. NC0429]|nr:hypothetical protein F5Y14DRAFT_10041 [Nemania sp. NC0429]
MIGRLCVFPSWLGVAAAAAAAAHLDYGGRAVGSRIAKIDRRITYMLRYSLPSSWSRMSPSSAFRRCSIFPGKGS